MGDVLFSAMANKMRHRRDVSVIDRHSKMVVSFDVVVSADVVVIAVMLMADYHFH